MIKSVVICGPLAIIHNFYAARGRDSK